MRRLFANRSVRLAAGLTLAVLIPVAVLVVVQVAALRDLERTSAVVLRSLSRQTADALASGIQHDFERPAFEMERVDHLAIERFDLARVAEGLARAARTSQLADAYYLWSERAPPSQAGIVFELPTGGAGTGGAGPMPRFSPAGAESGRLIELARDLAAHRVPWGSLVETIDGRPHTLVVHLLFESSGREHLTSFIGFRVDLARLRNEYLRSLVTRVLADPSHRVGPARLMVAVTDQDGRTVFRSDEAAAAPWIDERVVPLLFFDEAIMPAHLPCESCLGTWRLQVGYGGASVAGLARASTVGQRALLATLVFVVLGGLLATARFVVKQVQLAETRSRFVANVTHDLKTPLALIQLFAETLELGRVKSVERAQEYYGIIGREARKLASLIDHVLDFSKVEAGRHRDRLAPVDLGDLVGALVERLGPAFERDGFRVALSVAPDLPRVAADADAVELAAGNLLANATKYSGASRDVAVSVGRSERFLTVRVEDHGLGIPKELHRRVFERFFRVERPGDPAGFGLGLAIVDQVMRAHHGRVELQSAPGRGSVFTLHFPIPKERRQGEEAGAGDRGRAPDAAGAS